MSTWVGLHPSAEVPAGSVVPADVGDLELVVWRSHDDRVVVMDARCPHQWSHLAAEGVVDGDELVCAAHFWRFDTSGCGTKLNVLGRRDEKADIAVHPCRERDGMIEAQLDLDDVLPSGAPATTADERTEGGAA